ncbi:hypothetical protein INT47_004978 [Mucor saturninus]|uniref:UvrD-like helicase ATP-binding domain-containing protein n=1 Tax=Mucor saturninus TaxID=64648 RepID=A0A8H7QSQ8_9FUNG|nr:hypothetical protein INT47_004978 [Mucor saturninus]
MSNNQKLQQALRSLNPLQYAAVTSDAESLQIVAGPGSGKTKVLTCRVSYLIFEKNINPCDIIVVTFTKKAATELQERLIALIGSSRAAQLQIGTFHSICISILRRNARLVDMKPNFKVIDDRKRYVFLFSFGNYDT